jgi:hypothetical protein
MQAQTAPVTHLLTETVITGHVTRVTPGRRPWQITLISLAPEPRGSGITQKLA